MWKDINGFLKDLRAYPEHFHKTDNKSLNLNSVPKSESTSKKKKKVTLLQNLEFFRRLSSHSKRTIFPFSVEQKYIQMALYHM